MFSLSAVKRREDGDSIRASVPSETDKENMTLVYGF